MPPGSAAGAGLASFAGAQIFASSRTLGQFILPYAYRAFYRTVASTARTLENAQYLRGAAQGGQNISEAEPALTAADTAADSTIPEIAEGAAEAATGAFEAAAGPGLLATGGPAGVLAVFLEIGIEAIMNFQRNEQNLADLAGLDTDLTALQTTAPDVRSFVGDGTGESKLAATLTAAFLPLSTTQSIPPVQPGDYNLVFLLSAAGQPTYNTRSFEYAGWNGLSEAAALNGRWFSERDTVCRLPHVNSLVPVIHYLDWQGRQWWAARFGDRFLVTKHGKENGGSDTYSDIGGCILTTINPSALAKAFLTADVFGSNISPKGRCSSFVTPSLQVKDPTGKNLTVQLAASPQLVNPSASVTFQPGVTKIYTINATGLPTPAITLQGNLPPGSDWGKTAGAEPSSLIPTRVPRAIHQCR